MVNSEVATLPKPSRVLFARVGSMTFYAGPQSGDERPEGGGAYNKENLGHEVFNFAEFHGHLFGTARVKSGHVDLSRIDPIEGGAEKLDEVLIIFVARQHVVGWYRHATVHADPAQLPSSVAKEMRTRLKRSNLNAFEVGEYRFETNAEDAVLLPTGERKLKTPGNVKGGFGQSNIRYPFRTSGTGENSKWMQKAIEYVLNYDKANLLTSPEAESDATEVAAVAQERAAGFQSNPQIRGAIEDHAMKAAKKELEKQGFRKFENTAATRPYDFTCTRAGKKFFVEVKGTQTTGNAILLTKNEVKHVKANAGSCVLVIIHSIKVSRKKVAKGGIPEITEKWNLAHGKLIPIQYLWRQ